MPRPEATGEQVCAELQQDLARWRDRIAAVPPGSGFDQQRNLLAAWIKEGQRLLDRLE
jgi:hypothetical protein